MAQDSTLVCMGHNRCNNYYISYFNYGTSGSIIIKNQLVCGPRSRALICVECIIYSLKESDNVISVTDSWKEISH